MSTETGQLHDDSDMAVGARWGVGGAVAQKFANEGFLVVLTTRSASNAAALESAIHDQVQGPGNGGQGP